MPEQMNENALPPGGAEVIGLLKELLKEAEAGRLVGVGVVVVAAPGNYSIAGTRSNLFEMLCGSEDLHDYYKAVKAQIIAQQVQQQQQGRIVRPPPGFNPGNLR